MNSIFLPTRPLVLGHRGDSAHAPENTLAAFRMALDQGADGIELDVRLSRDREVMVLHDAGVGRVSDGAGRIADLTRAEIRSLDAGSRFPPVFQGERIPALEEVFATFGDRPVYDLEIKNFASPGNGLEPAVLSIIRRFGLEDRVIISSFNPLAVRFFQHELPRSAAGLLLLGGVAGRLEESLLSWWASSRMVGLYHRYLIPSLIKRQKGRRVMVWGVKNDVEVIRAAQTGAAGIIADDPGMARSALDRA